MTDPEPVDTTAAILSSAATLLREYPFEDVTYADLAEASGVSERTVYRRFPTRSHLLEALSRWIQESYFPAPAFTTFDGLQADVRARFRAYDAAPAHAFVCARAATVSPTAGIQEPTLLTSALIDLVSTLAPTLNQRDAGRITATLRYFSAETFWARMRTGFDMDADEISDVSDRMIRGMGRSLPRMRLAA